MNKYDYLNEELPKIVPIARSYAEVLIKLGFEAPSVKEKAKYDYIHKKIRKLGLDTSHFQRHCHRIDNISGRKFGRLTVQNKFERRSRGDEKGTSIFWLCKCECGVEKFILRYHLINETVVSCGCWNRDNKKLPVGVAAYRKVISNYRLGARARNLECSLTDEELLELFNGDCHYCGIEPSNIYETKSKNGSFKYNGIDRVNNDIGYHKNNCVSCCFPCNEFKKVKTYSDFLDRILKIAKYRKLV